MGLGIGAIKYFIGVLLAPVGIISMYIFGGTIRTLFATLNRLFQGDFIQAYIEYFLLSALPPTSVEEIILQPILGAGVAAILWFMGMVNYLGAFTL